MLLLQRNEISIQCLFFVMDVFRRLPSVFTALIVALLARYQSLADLTHADPSEVQRALIFGAPCCCLLKTVRHRAGQGARDRIGGPRSPDDDPKIPVRAVVAGGEGLRDTRILTRQGLFQWASTEGLQRPNRRRLSDLHIAYCIISQQRRFQTPRIVPQKWLSQTVLPSLSYPSSFLHVIHPSRDKD